MQRYVVNPKFFFRRIGNECLLLDLETDEYFTLSETGGTILELMKEPRSQDDVVRALSTTFDVPNEPHAMEEDVERFFQELIRRSIVLPEREGQ